jgi:hypothetical protein
MGYIVEISEHKLDKATDYAEKMLKYGGMLMQCLTEWEDESGYGERGGSQGGYSRSMMGSRGGYGMRGGDMSYRDEEEWEDDEMMGERRGRRRRDSMGRYR